ncbi:MAG: Sec1 family protein, partial [archaeon]|nr:Sec1 family protein [archaeon]
MSGTLSRSKPSTIACDLQDASIDLDAMRRQLRHELLELVGGLGGNVALVLDPRTAGLLSHVVSIEQLRSAGVSKIHYISAKLETPCKTILYLLRDQLKHVQWLCDHYHDAAASPKKFILCMVPRRSVVCEKLLEGEGLYGEVEIHEWYFDWVALDQDLVSMDLPQSFRQCSLQGDRSSVYSVALFLDRLQKWFGDFTTIRGKGRIAFEVSQLLRDLQSKRAPSNIANIHRLILVDRTVDLVTPLLTQHTYEGLLDEVFEIRHGSVKVSKKTACLEADAPPIPDSSKPGSINPSSSSSSPSPPQDEAMIQVPLNSSDALFKQIRDLNIAAIPSFLKQKATEIKQTKEQVRTLKTLWEIKQLTSKISDLLPHQRTLLTHISFAERIQKISNEANFRNFVVAEQAELSGDTSCMDLLTTMMDKDEPLVKVLRLACLRSLCVGGFPPKEFDAFREQLLHTYGFDHLFSLYHLEKLGLLFSSGPKLAPFRQIAKQLQLLHPAVDVHKASHPAYTYSGYSPLSVRYVEKACAPAWIEQSDA